MQNRKSHLKYFRIYFLSFQIESQFSKETSPYSTILQYCTVVEVLWKYFQPCCHEVSIELDEKLIVNAPKTIKTFDARKIIALFSYLRNYVETVDELYRRERS